MPGATLPHPCSSSFTAQKLRMSKGTPLPLRRQSLGNQYLRNPEAVGISQFLPSSCGQLDRGASEGCSNIEERTRQSTEDNAKRIRWVHRISKLAAKLLTIKQTHLRCCEAKENLRGIGFLSSAGSRNNLGGVNSHGLA